jgi:hypothetical protein
MSTLSPRLLAAICAIALGAASAGLAVGRFALPASDEPGGVRVTLPDGGVAFVPEESYERLQADEAAGEARSTVRAAVPAIEAWYADHGTYAGATTERLRAIDFGIPERLRVVSAGAESYCVETTVDGHSAHMKGPTGPVADGRC